MTLNAGTIDPERDFATLLHLFQGSCLLAGGCQLCDTVEGPTLPFNCLRVEAARALWAERKEELVEAWSAHLDRFNQPGRFFPWFAEALFDYARLPDCDPRWPERVRNRYRHIACNLSELRQYMQQNPA